MRHYFIFDGMDSRDFGVYISGKNTFNGASRSQKSISIPGRNGDLTLDNGKFDNVKLTYPAFIVRDFSSNLSAFRDLISTKKGFLRLEDSYHPDEYRIAKLTGAVEVETLNTLNAGNFELTFDCYPQRFLKSGETQVMAIKGNAINNPTNQNAYPLLEIYDPGTLTIGDIRIEIASFHDTYINIDCFLQEAYKDALSNSLNSYVSLPDGEFPYLKPGNTTITWTGSMYRVYVTPRWWII